MLNKMYTPDDPPLAFFDKKYHLRTSKDFVKFRYIYLLQLPVMIGFRFTLYFKKSHFQAACSFSYSWIAVKDVAQFAVASLENAFAKNATIELGGPDALSPLEVVQLFEQQSGKTFLVSHVTVEALQDQKAAATDPLQESFVALMLGYATGHAIDMAKVLEAIPVQLASVKDYAAQVTSGLAAANV